MSNEVWLKIKLPDELHKQLRMTALTNGETLGEFAVRLLGGCMGGPAKWKPFVTEGPIGKSFEEVVKQARVEAKTVTKEPKHTHVDEWKDVGEGVVDIEYKTCLKCKGKVAVADAERTRDGKYLCRDCADDLRVANA